MGYEKFKETITKELRERGASILAEGTDWVILKTNEKVFVLRPAYLHRILSTFPVSVDTIAAEIVEFAKGELDGSILEECMTEITDYDSVKDKISVGLISADKVQEGIAARYFADLAMILYYQIEELEDHSDVNAILTTDLVKIWQKQEKDLFVDAMSNTQKVYPAMLTWNLLLSPMEYLTRDMFLTDTGTGISVAREKFENGAIAALYPGFLKTISEKLNTGMLYLFFTSKHEFVVHDARIISPTDILVVGRSVIRDATSESDFLSGQVFQYIADTDEIRMIVLEGTRKIVVSSMRIADLTLTR